MKPDILVVRYVTASLFKKQCATDEFWRMSPSMQDDICSFAADQGVLSPFVGLLNLTAPQIEYSDEMYSWFGLFLQIENDYMARIETMKQLARLFSKEGIDIMFLKGATLAKLYPCPNWRSWSDIDYYVFGRSAEGIRLLETIGSDTNDYYHHHTQSSLNGILIENHYDFFDRHNHKCNHILDDAMKELAKNEGRSYPYLFEDELDIKNSYMMSPTMNAIFLMRHMSAHFVSETVSLRQLYDYALFLKADGKNVDWTKVIDLYGKSGMMRFAQIIISIVTNKLGVDVLESGCPIMAAENGMADKVWQSIVSVEGCNPYKRYNFRYMLYEVMTFFKNRWKHSLVYPGESYLKLFFIYSWSHIKRMMKGESVHNEQIVV